MYFRGQDEKSLAKEEVDAKRGDDCTTQIQKEKDCQVLHKHDAIGA